MVAPSRGGQDVSVAASKVKDLVAAACSSNDARFIGQVLSGLVDRLSGSEVEAAVKAVSAIVEKQIGLNSVAIEGLHQLRCLSKSACNSLARKIMSQEPSSDDREMVHAAAVSLLIESRSAGDPDLEIIGRCLNRGFPAVRRACQSALRGLSAEARGQLLKDIGAEGDGRFKDVRIFLETAPMPLCDENEENEPLGEQDVQKSRRPKAAQPTGRKESAVTKAAKSSAASKAAAKVREERELARVEPKQAESFEDVKLPQVSLQAAHESSISGQVREIIERERSPELAAFSLQKLELGATSGSAVNSVMANLAELALRYSPQRAADLTAHLVFLLSDPSQPEKARVGGFVQAIIGAASQQIRLR